jgi:hypothetical protein
MAVIISSETSVHVISTRLYFLQDANIRNSSDFGVFGLESRSGHRLSEDFHVSPQSVPTNVRIVIEIVLRLLSSAFQYILFRYYLGAQGSVVVNILYSKPDGRGVETRLCE